MRKILFAALAVLFLTAGARAQASLVPPIYVVNSTAGIKCTTKDASLWIVPTGGSAGVYRCSGPNTVTPVGAVFTGGSVASPVTAPSFGFSGTAGSGYLDAIAQSSNPAAPSGGFRFFADATGRLSWRRASDGFTRTFDATLTADRVFTLPDAAGTFVLDSNTQTVTGKTMRGPDGSATAPTYSFSNFTNSGMHTTSGNLRFSVNGALIGQFTSTGLTLLPSSNAALAFPSGEAIVEAAANTLAIRNGASAQALLVNNTYTDSSNGEWAALQWGSNRFDIFTTKNGTGTQRDIRIRAGASNGAYIDIRSNQDIIFGNGIAGTLWQFGGSSQMQTNVTQSTITTSQPFLNHTATWNASGVTFTNFLSNVTDTASASGSLLMDLQVGGSSKFKVDKAGFITVPTNQGMAVGSQAQYSGSVVFANDKAVCWSSTASSNGSIDLCLARASAGIVKVTDGSTGTGRLTTIGIRSGTSSNTDLNGQLTLSSGTASYTFASTYTSAPICVATNTSAATALQVTVTTTTLTLTGTGTDVVNYICMGRN